MNIKEDRIFQNYYLDEYSLEINSSKEACDKCELSDLCDRIADDVNDIGYCICLDKSEKYKHNHPTAYYKKTIQF